MQYLEPRLPRVFSSPNEPLVVIQDEGYFHLYANVFEHRISVHSTRWIPYFFMQHLLSSFLISNPHLDDFKTCASTPREDTNWRGRNVQHAGFTLECNTVTTQ